MTTTWSASDPVPAPDPAAASPDRTPPSGGDGQPPSGDGQPPTPATSTAASRPHRHRARWERPAEVAVLLATAVLHLVNLSASGWANSFYAAAVQAGTKSWKAFFFGCSDMACSITVDKSPLALWPMELSGRIFGFGSWSMLAPQALMAVGTVWLVMASVRRWFGTTAGLLAGGVLALTPVAVLMFRFNNPDAALVLLMTAAAYATLRALEAAFDPGTRRAATGWLVLAGAFVGLGFLAKMLQVLLVVPALALVYLLCAPNPLRRRVFDLLLSGLAMLLAAGWWVAVVSLAPASSRPYIGGSQNNSVIELMLGYNGLGRLNGEETGSVGGGPGGLGGGQVGRWGSTGLTRMFGGDISGQIAWLLPAALVLLVVGLVLAGRRPRTDVRRAAFALWGGWLVVTALTFSLMQGIFHQYYTVALAPAVAALVGMGSAELWQRRGRSWALPLLAVIVGGSAVWSAVLLGRADGWQTWLAPTVLVAAVVAMVGLVAVRFLPRMRTRVVLAGVGGAALVSVLAGPAAYSVQTVATPHTGSIVTAGPVVSGGFGPGRPGGRGGFGPGGQGFPGGLPPMSQGLPGGANGQGSPGGANGQGFPGSANGQGGTATGGARGGTGARGGIGGLLGGAAVSTELKALLSRDADSFTWVAATVGAQNAAGYQLATGHSVMPIGGFNGSDPSPTLAQFQAWVAQGRIHFFVAGGGMGGMGGGTSTSSQITAWVEDSFTATTVDGVTVYDLTS